ncbi:MAG: Smr/MutS family protein [Lentisphaeria bacterium]|jgi:DNA mismatch repair protein MutS2
MTFSHAATVLELPELLAAVAEFAGSSAGRARILALRPLAGPDAARARHPLLQELLQLRATAATPPPQPPLPDLDPTLQRAAPEGAILAGDELAPVRTALAHAATAAAFAAAHATPGTALASLLAGLDPLPALARRLDHDLDAEGTLLDGASERLAEIRRARRDGEARLHHQLEALLARWTAAGSVQDPFITQRNGRCVIPVRREAKHRPAGVVHDHSDSGRTLFLEPADTLPLGNELACLRLEERDECRRILASLTAALRLAIPALRRNQEILAEFDAAAASAAWASEFNCAFPSFGPTLRLRQVRHPLLAHRFRREGTPERLIPLDLELPADTRVLLISGPNSGGKTAALKALGLLTLLAQAGLPLPIADGGELPWFQAVLADIGDEQSLGSDLSTFTGHLRRLRETLAAAAAARPALVLLDEAGTGTDPLEGAALAAAVLDQLAGWGGLTLATTHLGALKSFVQDRPGMHNAAVRFNPDTLQPEYALEIGAPGASRALAVAARVGFPEPVLARAKELLASDVLRLETMLATIEDAQREAARQERESRETATGLADERRRLRDQLDRLRHERRQLLHDAERQAAALVANTRREMERILSGLAAAAGDEERRAKAREARATLEQRRHTLETAAAETAPKPPQPAPPRELRPGRTVWVEKLQANARIVAVSDAGAQLEVELGGLRYRLKAADAGRRQGPAEATDAAPPKPATLRLPRAESAPGGELHLIGRRVDEALPLLDQYLDRAALAGLPEVWIVHGFGSGRLQAAIHEHLRRHPLALRFRLGRGGADPGGGGVTWVELRRR